MPLIYTRDRAYLFAIDDENDHEQSVVYDRNGAVLWDRHGYEAGQVALGSSDPPPWAPPPAPNIAPDVAPAPPVTVGRVLRVTDERDGTIAPREYSYWANAWIDTDGSIVVFAGIKEDGLVHFFRVMPGGDVRRLGSPLPYPGESEGWYWDAAGWIYLIDGPRLRRVNPFTGEDRVVFDISATHPGCEIWQAHSSDDGRVHSATVKDRPHPTEGGSYPNIGTVVFDGDLHYIPANGVLDESQITPDGRWLVIKEDDDMRVVDLEQGTEHFVPDRAGALGHSDCGPGIVVGEFSQGDTGECTIWDLATMTFRVLFQTWNMGHVALRGALCLRSDPEYISLVNLATGEQTRLVAHGATGTPYDDQVKANLDSTGRIACFMTNSGTARQDIYLLELG